MDDLLKEYQEKVLGKKVEYQPSITYYPMPNQKLAITVYEDRDPLTMSTQLTAEATINGKRYYSRVIISDVDVMRADPQEVRRRAEERLTQQIMQVVHQELMANREVIEVKDGRGRTVITYTII